MAEQDTVSDAEAGVLLAFVDVMERQRLDGKISAWRITRGDHWFAEVLTLEQQAFMGGGDTFDAARLDLSTKMIAAALDGWPGAGSA